MEDYCYKSSDKHASIGYCSHFKTFFSPPFFVICQKWKIQDTFFPLNGCPVLELLIWSECGLSGVQIGIPKFWHPPLVMSPVILHHWTTLWNRQQVVITVSKYMAFGLLKVSPVFLLCIKGVWRYCFFGHLLYSTFNYVHEAVAQSTRTLAALLLMAEMRKAVESDNILVRNQT